MKLEFANTDKKINSTAIVSNYTQTFNGAKFKEESNLTFPIFMIGTNSIDYTDYNYVKVTFSNNQVKYYFINSFELGTNNCWYIRCTMDVLATFRDSILNKTLYILRTSDLNYHNMEIVDTLYPRTSEYIHKHTSNIGTIYVSDMDNSSISEEYIPAVYFSGKFNHGYYYIKILQEGHSVDSPGGVQLYVIAGYAFSSFINKIFGIDYSGLFPDIADGVARGIANIFQYIVEIFWLPVKNPSVSLGSLDMKIGTYNITIPEGAALIEDVSGIQVSFAITGVQEHPQAINYGNYLNSSPYTLRTLSFYPFGVYDLSDGLAGSNFSGTYWITLKIDVYTGQTIIEVRNNHEIVSKNHVIVRDVKDYKLQVPILDSSVSLLGVAGDVINKLPFTPIAGAGAGIAAGAAVNALAPGAGAAASVVGGLLFGTAAAGIAGGGELITGKKNLGIGDALIGAGTQVHSNGTLGAIMPYGIAPMISSEFCYVAGDDTEDNGRPVCRFHKLSNLSGYVLCEGNNIGIQGASQDQLNMIKEYLTSGFFIE